MYTRIEGNFTGIDDNIAIVISRFNEFITGKLLSGALDALARHGISENQITIIWCPGAFEIPLVAKKLTHSEKYAAIICLGAVIRGETPHFEYVANEVAKGIAQISQQTEIPISFGIITSNTIEQAIERAGTKAGNKGFDASMTALEMISLLKQL